MARRSFRVELAAGLLFGSALALSCTEQGAGSTTPAPPGTGGELTVYSGRAEKLVGPLLDRFASERGIKLHVRYGQTAEMAATLMEEGTRTTADVFLSQDAAELGALSHAGLLRPLPQELLDLVPARFRSPQGDWVGLSGRVRVVVYNPERVAPADLPQSLEQVTEPRFRGRFGIAPPNASFQAHMAVYSVVEGKEALRRLLDGMAANQPRVYSSNMPIVEAVINGEIDWGLVNHYYLWRALAEKPGAPARNFIMPEGAASDYLNVSGAGLVRPQAAGIDLLRFLLSASAQTYFAKETFEYPLAADVHAPPELPPLEQLASPDITYAQVGAALPSTLQLIRDSGLGRLR